MKKFRNQNPYIIAEVGVNHEGDIDTAKRLIELAKEGGAHAVKFQTYKANSLVIKDSPAYWDKKVNPISNQHELYSIYDKFGKHEYFVLAEHCKAVKIDFASTAFDEKSVDMLDSIMPFYKIASADLTNYPLLRKIASKKKPILLSTGASNKVEVANSLKELLAHGGKEICLLHCMLSYPTENKDANLNMIEDLKESFPKMQIGYSDHTLPDNNMLICTLAFLKGATIIEKHFTHDKSLPGNDHFHAMDINDLKKFTENLKLIQEIQGSKDKTNMLFEEIARKNARRSIVFSMDLKKNCVIEPHHLACKRPATGVSPIHWDTIIGKKLKNDVNEDSVLNWSDIK